MRRPRTWVPLDCTFWDDPKIVRAVELAGHEAGAIYQRLVGWAMQNGTQGLIPKRIPHGWTDNPRPILDALTTVGLVSTGDRYISVVAWLNWNEALGDMKRRRDLDRERQQRKRARHHALSTEELSTSTRDQIRDNRGSSRVTSRGLSRVTAAEPTGVAALLAYVAEVEEQERTNKKNGHIV